MFKVFVLLLVVFVFFKYFCTKEMIEYEVTPPYLRIESKSNNVEPRTDSVLYLVVHSTANDSLYANASFHSTYLDTTSRKVSWHYTVDDRGIIKHFPDSLVCYHSSSRLVNKQSIGIELCENKGYNKEMEMKLLRVLIRQIRKTYPDIKVIFHDEVYKYDNGSKVRKKCPRILSTEERNSLR